jgi:hypothetical protein
MIFKGEYSFPLILVNNLLECKIKYYNYISQGGGWHSLTKGDEGYDDRQSTIDCICSSHIWSCIIATIVAIVVAIQKRNADPATVTISC